jgi:NADH-quinone oxidoreductase subunit J
VTGEVVAFWVLAIVLVGSALAVVLSKNLFHSVLWLALSLTGTAGIFLMLQAEFLAAVQILLYAGGVITVVVFAIVVTERLVGERLTQTNRRIGGALVASIVMFAAVARFILQGPAVTAGTLPADLTQRLGELVVTDHVLAFELVGVLLLVSLLSASYFARPED